MYYRVIKHFVGWVLVLPFLTSLTWFMSCSIKQVSSGIQLKALNLQYLEAGLYFSVYGCMYCLIVTLPVAIICLCVITCNRSLFMIRRWRILFLNIIVIVFLLFSMFTSKLTNAGEERFYLYIISPLSSFIAGAWTLNNLLGRNRAWDNAG